jgi:hypothetical protein
VLAIDNTGRRLAALDESERPDQVVFVIITDGQENASRTYKRSDVNQRITRQRTHYNWDFIYLGANQDTFAEALSFGIPQAMAMNYTASVGGTASALGSTISNTVSYAKSSGASRGLKSYLNFDEEQRKKAVEDKKDGQKSNT